VRQMKKVHICQQQMTLYFLGDALRYDLCFMNLCIVSIVTPYQYCLDIIHCYPYDGKIMK